ncbi:MAG: leucine-rich repeat domain-containing protein [Planctomycetes bacterium]|nr:leucine-rich repeat domain-containing protein [Planctomycetota bacterium]
MRTSRGSSCLGSLALAVALLIPAYSVAAADVTYEIWRSTTNNPATATRLEAWWPGTSFDDTSVQPGLVYYYWVKVVTSETVHTSDVWVPGGDTLTMDIWLTCPTSAKRGETSPIRARVEMYIYPSGAYESSTLDLGIYEEDALDDGTIEEWTYAALVTYNSPFVKDNTVDAVISSFEPSYDNQAEVYLYSEYYGFWPVDTDRVLVSLRDTSDVAPGGLAASQGTYSDHVHVQWSAATGNSGFSSAASGWASSTTHSVSVPNRPTGHTQLFIDEVGSYSATGAACSLGHPVQYQFDWDDGASYSSWSSSSRTHSWSLSDLYDVRARARCSSDTGVVSSWSSALSVRVYADELTPTCPQGSNAPNESLGIVSFGSTVSYTITDNVTWLSVSPASGTSTGPDDVQWHTVSYSTAGLPVGSHPAIITVHGFDNELTFLVTLTVTEPPPRPTIACSTTSLSTACNYGANATNQAFEVWNSGDVTLDYTISDNAVWLEVVPASGTSSGSSDRKTHTVQYSSAGLAPGVHPATITISDPDASNNPQTISVALTVRPEIPDAALRQGIAQQLGIAPAEITVENLDGLEWLSLEDRNISNLEGLQYCSGLRGLYLSGNPVTDISPLSGLTKLEELHLHDCPITDFTPLATMTGLYSLDLGGHNISDLAGLVSLLSQLPNLAYLYLDDAGLTDISPLSPLTQLEYLQLGGNQITDFSPLAPLTNLWGLHLPGNPLDDLENLVTALHDNQNLWDLWLDDCGISDISPLANLNQPGWLHLRGNPIEDFTALASLSNLRGLYLDRCPIENLTALVTTLSAIPNLNLLMLKDTGLTDISPLVNLSNITDLGLGDDEIQDYSILASMANLESLYLQGDSLPDLAVLVSLLVDLPDFTGLYLESAGLTDISPLANLTSLASLGLNQNRISDLTPLTGLTNLSLLYLEANRITDIQPLVDNPGMGSQAWSSLVLSGNPLGQEALSVQIPALQSRGVSVWYDSPGVISAQATAQYDWVYQNTPNILSHGGHEIHLELCIWSYGQNQSLSVTAAKIIGSGTGEVAVEDDPGGDQLVKYVYGSMRTDGMTNTGTLTLRVTVTGNVAGETTVDVPITVRPLGDIDGNGGAEPTDMSALINKLNGLDTSGFPDRAFDLDSNGGAEPGDLSLLINVLNGLPLN